MKRKFKPATAGFIFFCKASSKKPPKIVMMEEKSPAARYIRLLSILILLASSYAQQPSGKRHLPIECDHAAPPRGMHWVCNDPNNSCNCRLENDGSGHSPWDDDDGQPIHKPNLPTAAKSSADDFYRIMNTIAEARSGGNAAQAADMFTGNAMYSDLARGQTYKGQAEIKKLFSNGKGSVKSVRMVWHHLLFNEQEQIGAGEFSVDGLRHEHGMVLVKVENGKISNWREYRSASHQSWDKFIGENQF